jgi:D-glycero-D-manno-heptose 1,7-bisphosphate phosphatase
LTPSAFDWTAFIFARTARSQDAIAGSPCLGLMRQASKELGFDMSQAIVIGDKDSDIEFGRRAGALTILIAKSSSRTVSMTGADYVVENLDEAADILSGLQ